MMHGTNAGKNEKRGRDSPYQDGANSAGNNTGDVDDELRVCEPVVEEGGC